MASIDGLAGKGAGRQGGKFFRAHREGVEKCSEFVEARSGFLSADRGLSDFRQRFKRMLNDFFGCVIRPSGELVSHQLFGTRRQLDVHRK